MSYTIPSDGHSVGDTGHTTDHNDIVDVLRGMGALANVLNTAYSGGADPTGSADSTAAAQATITALSAFGGGGVRFPAGTYKLTPPSATVPALTIPSNVTLLGDGFGATELLKNANGPLLDFSGAGPISQTGSFSLFQGVRDLAINGNGKTGLIYRLYYVQCFYEENVYIHDNADVAVDAVQLWDSRFTRGLYLYGGSASASAISGAQAVTHLIRNSAAPATTLSAGISGTITALPVSALPEAMPAGIVQLWNSSGQLQNFTTTGAANGATSIPVTSAAVAHTFVTGNAVNGFGWSGDSTNATTFDGCHWENGLSGAIWITPGVGSTAQPNAIFVTNTKVEEDLIGYNCPLVQVDPGCSNIQIDHLYCYAGGFNAGFSTAVPAIYFHPNNGSLDHVWQSDGTSATVTNGIDVGTASGGQITVTDVYQYWVTSPTVAGVNGTAGTPTLTNVQVNGTVTTAFAGTYALNNGGAVPLAGNATIAGVKTFTGGVVIEQPSGSALIVSSDGTATADGAVVVSQNGSDSYLAVYSAGAGTYYGVSAGIVSGIVSLFGYYVGLGVIGVTTGTGSPVFGALASDQFGSGLGSTAFTVYDDNGVTTFSNTLDDGSGNAAVAGTSTVSGVSHLNGGTDTSGTAAASSPTFVSGTALQLSTTQDVMLYIDVTVATNLTLAIGSTSSATTTIFTSATAAIGVITLRVPKGWYVKATSTGTFANFGFKQVTC